MKQYKQLTIPTDTAWSRKSWRRYCPIWLNKLLEGVYNIWIWIPLIFKDKNWDASFIFKVLQFKLLQQRKELVRANRFVGVEQVNRDITICLNLIERILEDYYELENQDYCETKTEFIESEEKFQGESTYEYKSEIIKENFDDYFKKYPNAYRKIQQGAYPFFKGDSKEIQAMALAHFNQERCQTLLFKILDERVNRWWD